MSFAAAGTNSQRTAWHVCHVPVVKNAERVIAEVACNSCRLVHSDVLTVQTAFVCNRRRWRVSRIIRDVDQTLFSHAHNTLSPSRIQVYTAEA